MAGVAMNTLCSASKASLICYNKPQGSVHIFRKKNSRTFSEHFDEIIIFILVDAFGAGRIWILMISGKFLKNVNSFNETVLYWYMPLNYVLTMLQLCSSVLAFK